MPFFVSESISQLVSRFVSQLPIYREKKQNTYLEGEPP
jgi:hypothetical protein